MVRQGSPGVVLALVCSSSSKQRGLRFNESVAVLVQSPRPTVKPTISATTTDKDQVMCCSPRSPTLFSAPSQPWRQVPAVAQRERFGRREHKGTVHRYGSSGSACHSMLAPAIGDFQSSSATHGDLTLER
jgi:hypothetical protein